LGVGQSCGASLSIEARVVIGGDPGRPLPPFNKQNNFISKVIFLLLYFFSIKMIYFLKREKGAVKDPQSLTSTDFYNKKFHLNEKCRAGLTVLPLPSTTPSYCPRKKTGPVIFRLHHHSFIFK
jgi:hypothetical protein